MNALTTFICDLCIRNLDTPTMRQNYRDGKYNGIREQDMRGYFAMWRG